MMPRVETFPSVIPTPDGDIDWELLMMLARTEAAMTWPDLSLPDGLDLRHGGDHDWVSQVVEMADRLPGMPAANPMATA